MFRKTTVKITRRVNIRSPKYGFGFHRINSGWRFDVPYNSVSVFSGPADKRTVRNPFSGLRIIYENNRQVRTRVAHNL